MRTALVLTACAVGLGALCWPVPAPLADPQRISIPYDYPTLTISLPAFKYSGWKLGTAEARLVSTRHLLFLRLVQAIKPNASLYVVGYSDGVPFLRIKDTEEHHRLLGACRAQVVKRALVKLLGPGRPIRICGERDLRSDGAGAYRRVIIRTLPCGQKSLIGPDNPNPLLRTESSLLARYQALVADSATGQKAAAPGSR